MFRTPRLPMFDPMSANLGKIVGRITKRPRAPDSLADTLRMELRHEPLRIYADTCALLHDSGMELLEALEEVLPEYGQKLRLFASVLYELENVARKDPKLRPSCEAIREKLGELEEQGLVQVIMGADSHFSDVNFLAKFISEMQSSNLLLLTQDRALAETAAQLREFVSPCISANYTIQVKRLTPLGGLEAFRNTTFQEVNYDPVQSYRLCTDNC
ncbi:MAG: hypothetical protein IJ265_08965 [Oscillospiraceae bacterium]|nr:hypothetical protein [Oscillospiraceae bacterium]